MNLDYHLKSEMAVNIDIEAVTEEEEILLDANQKWPDVLMRCRKGTGLLSGPCQELQSAAMEGNFDAAQKIFNQDRNSTTQKISPLGLTALHVAASCGRSDFVKKLVRLLTPEDLKAKDQIGRTALHHVALAADVSAAEALVKKNPDLPLLGDYDSRTPFYYAARWRHRSKSKEMVEYLYKVTIEEKPSSSWIYTGELGAKLVVALTASWCYNVALRILKCHPDLAIAKTKYGKSILYVLAMQFSAFSDGGELSPAWELLTSGKKMTKKETKQRQEESLQLVDLVCKELRKQSDLYIFQYFLESKVHNRKALLHLAVEKGVFRMVEVCLKYFPELISYKSHNRTLLHEAIEHRRVEIFNHLIDLIGRNTKAYAGSKVDKNGNILHLAARYSTPSNQLMVDTVPGPAFQMRRELQWFKAVETLIYEELAMDKNEKGQTPRELFFEGHKDLLNEAKGWMKDTSNSCMVVATLVATVAFAAMITVPGGNNSSTGLPVLSNQKLFVAFSISNILSMISSSVTLLMFLSVYTSRFTENDFMDMFPKVLLRGLIALFIAIATMMIAFGTAIGLALQRRVKWAYIPITILACCPALIFTRLQLPLLFQVMVFESGPGIYRGQRDGKCLKKIGSIVKICVELL